MKTAREFSLLLVLTAIVAAVLLGGSPTWAQSPLPDRSPIRTPESHWKSPGECLSWCEDMMPLAPEGWCTCWCGVEANGACSFVPYQPQTSLPDTLAKSAPDPTPTPTQAPPACTPSGSWPMAPWMGRYAMSWDGCQYQIDFDHPVAAAE
jgi:hypothetical protein